MELMMWIAREEYGGWFRPYALFLLVGFIAAIVAAWIRFKMRHIPTRSLEVGIFIIVPAAAFGASFFGKLDPVHPIFFFELFAFWEPGLSVHGGLIFGIIAGYFWFRHCAYRDKISTWVYADLILPNVLLGQAIGRWGNFFNHELFGKPVSRGSLDWLPSFIRNNSFKWYTSDLKDGIPIHALGINGQGVNPSDFANVQYFNPIAIYESFVDLVLWIVLIFVLPYLFRWLASKPWQKRDDGLTVWGWWSENYYNYVPDPVKVQQASEVFNLYTVYEKNVKKISPYKNQKKHKQKVGFATWLKWKWNSWLLKWNWRTQRWAQLFKQDRKALDRMENPHNLTVLRCGVQGALYIFAYDFIRFFMELQREPSGLFLINMVVLDYIVLWLFILIGLGLVACAQWVSPSRWRQGGWLYEKQY